MRGLDHLLAAALLFLLLGWGARTVGFDRSAFIRGLPVALVVLKPEYVGKVSGKELRLFLEGFVEEGVITKWSIPDNVNIVDGIPKTSVGKINKREIRKNLAEYS